MGSGGGEQRAMPVKHGTQLVRDYNQKMVYNLIHAHGSLSRTDLTRITKMSPASVSKMVGTLLEEGLILERSAVDASLGRKPMLLSINPEGILVIGINVDVRRITAGLVAADGRVLIYEDVPNNANCRVEDIPQTLARLTRHIKEQMSPEQQLALIGAGVSIPGVVSYPEGKTYFSPQFRWKNYLLRLALEEAMEMRVLVDNNVKAVAVQEQIFGMGRNVKDFVVVQIGSGVGGAVVTGGKLYRGENNMTGEFGHMQVCADGPICDCGRRGCLQAYTCISGIEERAGKSIAQVLRDAPVDEKCSRVLEEAENCLCMWLANLKNLYNPSLLILYGELLEIWPGLMDRIRVRVSRTQWLGDDDRFTIAYARMNERSMSVISSAAILLAETIQSGIVIHETAIDNAL